MLLYKANGNDCVVTNYSTNPLITRKNGRKTTHRGMIKVKECVPALAYELVPPWQKFLHWDSFVVYYVKVLALPNIVNKKEEHQPSIL